MLPTGAGKTHVAVLAIDDKRRSTLVVAPTLDLVRQWYDLLARDVRRAASGVVGGGEHDVQPLTVTTYDSAYLHMEHLGARFGLVVFDECHHLPSAALRARGALCLAPFRLGPHRDARARRRARSDARRARSGPIVYRKDIVELAGRLPRRVRDRARRRRARPRGARRVRRRARASTAAFVAANGIRMASPAGWGEFIMRSSRSDEGRRAMHAYRRQRELAFAAPAKLDYVEHLLDRHRARPRAPLHPGQRHRVRRSRGASSSRSSRTRRRCASAATSSRASPTARYGAVVTSKVLNEGVDVPDANVAIVVSGSGSVREHVQRLGRILRKKDGKRAILYELVTARHRARRSPASGAGSTVLTADLVTARRRGSELSLTRIDDDVRRRAESLADQMISMIQEHAGLAREELDAALATIDAEPRDQRLKDGLLKLLDDRCEWAAKGEVDPESLRSELFALAARAQKTRDVTSTAWPSSKKWQPATRSIRNASSNRSSPICARPTRFWRSTRYRPRRWSTFTTEGAPRRCSFAR